MMWSDGAPLTSRDIWFTFKSTMDPRTAALPGPTSIITGYQDFRDGKVDSPPGLVVVDDNTFHIDFDTPNAGFVPSISFLGFQILPEHILGSVDPTQLQQHPYFLNPTVGSGPFTFVTYETDQYVEVQRNPNFWGTPANLERIFVHTTTPDVATAQLQKGEILHTQIGVTDTETLKNTPGITVANKPAAGIFLMAPMIDGQKFNDKRVRQALVYAIDRKGIVDQVLQGYGSVVNSHIIGPDWAINPNLNTYDYNPDKARSLLQDAGWDPNTPVVINWMNGQGGSDVQNALLIAQSQLQAVGIKADFQPLERGPLLDAITQRNFDLVSYGGGVYTVDPDSTSYVLMCQFIQPKGANNAGYCNPAVDDLFMRGRAATDQATRAQIYQQASAMINDDVSHVWLFVADAIYGYSNKLQGLKPHGDFNSAYWNANEWSVTA
jgi:peptide/nickel transport system substrate-binding protein